MTEQPLITPPPRVEAVVRAVLPDDPMRDAIVGDLHEEFVSDAARHGHAEARARYVRRVAGIVVHVAVDFMCFRRWESTAPAAERPLAPVPVRSGRLGRAEAGVGAVALGVLLVGIVANTMLFASTRHTTAAAPPTSALGIGAAVLALACAAVAAVVLCAGPRWLRRRLHQRAHSAV